MMQGRYDNVPVWEGESTSAMTLPRLAGEQHADVCVVGLGGSGLSAVLELLALGKSDVFHLRDANHL